VTLLFAGDRYEQAARAYQRGIERRARAGVPVDRVRSVASVFVSRIDALVAQRLGAGAP
jgi:transaldolase